MLKLEPKPKPKPKPEPKPGAEAGSRSRSLPQTGQRKTLGARANPNTPDKSGRRAPNKIELIFTLC